MIDVAIDAAKQAGELALRYFKTQNSASWRISYKANSSPVTRADIEAEKLIRKIISKKFPDHGIIGEELPPVNPKAKHQWVIDPIDGTRDFIRNIPNWAVYVALLKDKRPISSVIFFPTMGTLITAEKNKGTFLNGKRTKVSKTKDLEKAYVSVGGLKKFSQMDNSKTLTKIFQSVSATRSYADLGLIYLLEGKIDVAIEPYGFIHDYAPEALLVEEAGGKFTDFKGNFSLTSLTAVKSNGLLHSQVLKLLNEQ